MVITAVSGLTATTTEILEYREEKQKEKLEAAREQERKKILSEIQSNIISSNYPLIPFQLLYTLKYLATTPEIENTMSNSIVNKSLVKTEYLKLVGTAKLSDEPFNYEEESPNKLHCTIKDTDSLDNLIQKQELIKIPDSIKVEIFTEQSQLTPDIVLKTNSELTKRTVKELRIYDNTVYQDTIAPHWTLTTSQEKVFGVRDLLRSRIKVRASFFISDRTNDQEYPRFTNFLLYFGDNPTNLLSFTLDELLSKQATHREDEGESFFKFENELAKTFFQKLILEFEINITDEIYNNQIRQFAS
ncbi:MAG: hypothetical protein NUV74_06035 [Candidatus Brocadiaceae bacterium]|nr:hypothetical protein [Candidatus Brocadiaceae bacterium]